MVGVSLDLPADATRLHYETTRSISTRYRILSHLLFLRGWQGAISLNSEAPFSEAWRIEGDKREVHAFAPFLVLRGSLMTVTLLAGSTEEVASSRRRALAEHPFSAALTLNRLCVSGGSVGPMYGIIVAGDIAP